MVLLFLLLPCVNMCVATVYMLWEEVEDMYDRRIVDPPLCPHVDCPYCTGPLMNQRYDLMQRLVMLEKLIWLGDKRKKSDLGLGLQALWG